MIRAFDAAGQPIELEPEEAQRRFLAGEIQFRRGTRVPVRMPDGGVGSVAAEELGDALQGNFALAGDAELAEAESRARTGDQAGLAAGEGFIRGATAGLSDAASASDDPILRLVARSPLIATGLDDDPSALVEPERLQREIQERQEENPVAAAAGEVGGVLATAVAPSAAAGRAATAAERAALGISGAGEAVEQTLVREGAGRLARAGAVSTGAAVEGALEEVGREIGRTSLADEELTGEAVAGAATRGAILGFGGGAAFAAGAAAARPVVRGLQRAVSSESVDQTLGELAVGSLRPTAAQVGRLQGRNIDVADVGNMLLDADLISPRIGRGELVERIDGLLDGDLGPRIGNLLDELDASAPTAARIDAGRLAQRIQREVFEELEGPLQPAFVGRLRAQLDEVLDSRAGGVTEDFLTEEERGLLEFFEVLDREATEQIRRVRDTPDAELLRGADPDAIAPPRGEPDVAGTAPARRGADPAEAASRREAARAEDIREFADELQQRGVRSRQELRDRARGRAAARQEAALRLGFREAHGLRRALDKQIFGSRFGNLEQMTPAQAAMHSARQIINEEISAAMQRAERAAGGDSALRGTLESWRDTNRRYQGFVWAREVARRSHAREFAQELNRTGLDFGLAPALALVTGNPGLLVVGWLGGRVNRWMRANGKAVAAAGGRSITRRLGLVEARKQAERAADDAAESFLGRVRRAARVPATTKARILGLQAFRDKAAAIGRMPTTPESLDIETADRIAVHEIAEESLGAATSYAIAKLRAAQVLKDRLPVGRPELLSDTERASFMQFAEAVERPFEVLARASTGRVSFDHVDGIRAAYPRLYQRLVSTVAERMELARQKGEPVPYQQRVRMSLLFPELDVEPTMRPDALRVAHEPFLEQAGGTLGGSISQGPGPAPKPTPRLESQQLSRATQIAEG